MRDLWPSSSERDRRHGRRPLGYPEYARRQAPLFFEALVRILRVVEREDEVPERVAQGNVLFCAEVVPPARILGLRGLGEYVLGRSLLVAFRGEVGKVEKVLAGSHAAQL